MEDTEAEAVLLALGSNKRRLEWAPYYFRVLDDWKQLAALKTKIMPGEQTDRYAVWWSDQKNTVEAALVQDGYYSIRERRRFGVFRVCTACCLFTAPHELGQHPQKFKSRATARAACERHHATGKWE